METAATRHARLLESLIAQRKKCGYDGQRECRRPRCKRCRRGVEHERRSMHQAAALPR